MLGHLQEQRWLRSHFVYIQEWHLKSSWGAIQHLNDTHRECCIFETKMNETLKCSKLYLQVPSGLLSIQLTFYKIKARKNDTHLVEWECKALRNEYCTVGYLCMTSGAAGMRCLASSSNTLGDRAHIWRQVNKFRIPQRLVWQSSILKCKVFLFVLHLLWQHHSTGWFEQVSLFHKPHLFKLIM